MERGLHQTCPWPWDTFSGNGVEVATFLLGATPGGSGFWGTTGTATIVICSNGTGTPQYLPLPKGHISWKLGAAATTPSWCSLGCLISRENIKGYLGRFHPRESYPSDLSEWNGAFTKPAPGPGAPSLETGWIWPHSFWGLPLGGLVSGCPRDSYHSDLSEWDGNLTIPAPAQGTHSLKIGCSCGKFFMVLPWGVWFRGKIEFFCKIDFEIETYRSTAQSSICSTYWEAYQCKGIYLGVILQLELFRYSDTSDYKVELIDPPPKSE